MSAELPAYEISGYHYEWRAEVDSDWSLAAERIAGKRCRYTVGPGNRICGAEPVAALNRGMTRDGLGRVPSWWAYCGEHLYGRRIHNGVIEGPVQVPDEAVQP
ncbi:MAG: hypothetical protein A3E01_15200 [Gammaproteobacteria bacterium RIFCSPHIGHO2_12_FULL_63_22]|nr:MAG: hypothetical protein A3E01_15200 [Gammaproteobacteria bacterium RIFCSPHIGHO2_12_FULL_63_22]